jgi:hypothetical protein
MRKRLKDIIEESVNKAIRSIIKEGISFDYKNRLVSFDPSQEDIVDTSVENNPSVDETIINGVNVWSIFKRKLGTRGDGNPLIRALKGEENWKFRSDEDRDSIERQFELIAEKFSKLYPIGVTILVPSGNRLNNYIADVVMSKSDHARLLEGVVTKITTEEVEDIVMEDGSKFREFYGDNFNEAFGKLGEYLDDMDEERGGYFSRHYVKNPKMRNILDITLKVSQDRVAEFANFINGQNILIIDDTISRGQTIKEVVNVINESYAPKSITVLTLLSRLN